ncbi:hypothetical protein PC129_g5730 [Phytophthora cactorum]|uniref:Uncharacterized protein n=1 Tax=Phytophthora cactorum TaxID=29920 RepID=A0A8T1KC57_9STRA|nr:hypothetical protein PC117_g8273 [Phytophthora cactorum]KAG3026320.1 hypothetical protein PC119_g7862 [Phytophthora cactorum]KAG3151210.1 hypothetical protein C6341_g16619 [Phytophthora cactorum]KAG3223636.1 hypothetical protein PC129_g5730 [Phytophthora cactorum]KAG4232898.1 hypothetical protein PC116_g18875 [Phytophthora cactorum]
MLYGSSPQDLDTHKQWEKLTHRNPEAQRRFPPASPCANDVALTPSQLAPIEKRN